MDEEGLGSVGGVNDGLVRGFVTGLLDLVVDSVVNGLGDWSVDSSAAGGWSIVVLNGGDWLVDLSAAGGWGIIVLSGDDWLVLNSLTGGVNIDFEGFSDWLVDNSVAGGCNIDGDLLGDWLVLLSLAGVWDINDDGVLDFSLLLDLTEFVDGDVVISGGGDFVISDLRFNNVDILWGDNEDILGGLNVGVHNVVSGDLLGSLDWLGGVGGAVNSLWSVLNVGHKNISLSGFVLVVIDSGGGGVSVVLWLLSGLLVGDGVVVGSILSVWLGGVVVIVVGVGDILSPLGGLGGGGEKCDGEGLH